MLRLRYIQEEIAEKKKAIEQYELECKTDPDSVAWKWISFERDNIRLVFSDFLEDDSARAISFSCGRESGRYIMCEFQVFEAYMNLLKKEFDEAGFFTELLRQTPNAGHDSYILRVFKSREEMGSRIYPWSGRALTDASLPACYDMKRFLERRKKSFCFYFSAAIGINPMRSTLLH